MNTGFVVLSIFAGFICGSIPFGYLAGVLNRLDVRRHGSGNIGFTNVARILGLGWALPVLILDIAKGILPVIFAQSVGLLPVLVGLGAVLGHIFSPWLKFNGGKGVATTIGVAALLCPRSLFAALGLFLCILLITGYVSVSSISFAFILPVLTLIFYRTNSSLLLFTAILTVVIIYRHIPNLKRLLSRTEPKFGLWQRVFSKRV
jgi:glycerol-3-phosphate acyltransferase PlsY